jgi:succinate-acetate transporter protein
VSATTASQARARTDGRERDRLDAATRVVVQPIAAPSILGLFGFASATFMVSTHMAGWYGTPVSPLYLFPFAAMFGGVAQFLAGMWSYRARDGLGTAMHGMWGSFWIAYGILFLLVAVGAITVPARGAFPELGYWFLTLSAITIAGAVAATGESLGLFSVLAVLAVGAALAAVHYLVGGTGWLNAAGWVLFASSVLAYYTAAAFLLEGAFGRTVLPLGKPFRREANIPGERATEVTGFPHGEPGVRRGQ